MDDRLRAVTAGSALVVAATLALALPGVATAHSLVRVNGGEITSVSADATSLNTLTVRLVGPNLELRDPTVDGGMDPGPCAPGDVDRTGFIIHVRCPRAGVSLIRLDAGDREDTVVADLPIPVAALGGEGADRLRTGSAADTVDGGSGEDTVDAGEGNDTIRVRDGLIDLVRCGAGTDRVDADTLDDLAPDCEAVTRTPTAAPPTASGGGRDRTAPRVQAGASVRQRLGRSGVVRLAATSSEVGNLAASGYLDVAGLALPLSSRRQPVHVAGGGAELRIRLSRRLGREARRALRRGRRVTVRLAVVATDAAGNSAQARAPVIRLER